MHGMQVAQLAACNRLHEVDQRLVRWLLMCQDRVDSELLPLTHEFLAQMLGTGRPSVSLAAADLENAGLIENMRGTIRVLNRKSLEEAACECYGVIQHFNGGVGLKKKTPNFFPKERRGLPRLQRRSTTETRQAASLQEFRFRELT